MFTNKASQNRRADAQLPNSPQGSSLSVLGSSGCCSPQNWGCLAPSPLGDRRGTEPTPPAWLQPTVGIYFNQSNCTVRPKCQSMSQEPLQSARQTGGAGTASGVDGGGGLQTPHAGLTVTRTPQSPYLIRDIRDGVLTISQLVLKNKTLESDLRVRSKSTSYSCDSSARVDISVQMSELAAETPATIPSWTS